MKQLSLLLIIYSFSLSAMQMTDGDLTFTPPPPPKPAVLGLKFGSNQKEVSSFIAPFSRGQSKREELQGGRIVLLTFQGVPKGLTITSGRSLCYFYRDQLTKVVFKPTPSYENFLVIRAALKDSLGERYTLGSNYETMDPHLRQQLANIESMVLGGKSEQAIRSSIEEGKTFFSYTWNDNRGELDITLNYTADPVTRAPTLTLHYDYLPGIAEMQMSRGARMGGQNHPSLAPNTP